MRELNQHHNYLKVFSKVFEDGFKTLKRALIKQSQTMEKNFAVYEKKNFVSVMQTLSANSSRYQKQSETLQIITAFIEYERGFYLGINMRWV